MEKITGKPLSNSDWKTEFGFKRDGEGGIVRCKAGPGQQLPPVFAGRWYAFIGQTPGHLFGNVPPPFSVYEVEILDSKAPISDEKVAAYSKALDEKVKAPCPRCQHNRFSIAGESIVTLMDSSGNLPAKRFLTVIVWCKNCGFVMEHARETLLPSIGGQNAE